MEACLIEELNEDFYFEPYERLAGGAKPPNALKAYRQTAYNTGISDANLHRLIHLTNLIEHIFSEFRAKIDEVGAFPNEGSCLTLFYLVILHELARHKRFEFPKTS